MQQKIIKREVIADLPDGHGLHPVLARILSQRHCQYFTHSIKDLFKPDSLKNITLVCQKLIDIRKHKQNILVIGDYDCDGATASAIAVKGFRLLGFHHVDYLVPNRFKTGYGLTEAIVEMALTRDPKPQVLLTVDNGIASMAGVAYARAHGMDVVVTDHHLPGEHLPDTPYIVNPQLYEDAFPSKALCGAGVIFYVLLALRRMLADQGAILDGELPNFMDLIDLVTLGTVADCVPLDRNNRILIAQGLRRMRQGVMSVGMRALFDQSATKLSCVTSVDIAFKIAPKLNAAGRMDDMSIGVRCLLADNADEAMVLAKRLCDFNKERKDVQSNIQQDILNKLTYQDDSAKKSVVLYHGSWHQGVIGIIASRVKDERYKPTIIFTDDVGGVIKGSGRSIPGIHLRDILANIAAKHGILQKFGGHAMAAGLSLEKKHLALFTEAFEAQCACFQAALFYPNKYSDGPLSASELCLESATALADYGLWGQDYPEPVFENIFQVSSLRLLKDTHLKLELRMDGVLVQAMWFFFTDLNLPLPVVGHAYQMLYKLSINEYLGERRLCLFVEHAVEHTVYEIA